MSTKRIPWNKGKTKDTDERLKKSGEKISQSLKEGFATGEIKSWNEGLTKETDERLVHIGENISKAKKGKEVLSFKGHNWGWCKKCGKYHKLGNTSWATGHTFTGICKLCGKQHSSDKVSKERNERMKGDKNPMKNPETVKKMIESTDYEKTGKANSLRIQQEKLNGTYVPGMVILKKNNPEKYEEICKAASERMKLNNPMHNPETAQKVGETRKRKYANGEISFTEEGRKNISIASSKRMKINNPMFRDDVKEKVGKKIAILWATNPEWIERKDTMLMKDPEIAKRQSISLKKRWENEELKLEMLRKQQRKPNNLELDFLEFCKDNDFPFEYVGDRSFWIYGKVSKKGRNPDFINKKLMKVILVGAKYWHSNEEEEKMELEDYTIQGFDVLHIWDNDFYNDKEIVKSEIIKFLGVK